MRRFILSGKLYLGEVVWFGKRRPIVSEVCGLCCPLSVFHILGVLKISMQVAAVQMSLFRP